MCVCMCVCVYIYICMYRFVPHRTSYYVVPIFMIEITTQTFRVSKP